MDNRNKKGNKNRGLTNRVIEHLLFCLQKKGRNGYTN